MTFSHFIIFCIIILIGYYLSILWRPKKNKFSYENKNDFKAIDISIEPPIEVSSEMVSFTPTVHLGEASIEDAIDEITTDDSSSSTSIYNTPAISSQCEQGDMELSEYITQEVLQQGSALFSNLFI